MYSTIDKAYWEELLSHEAGSFGERLLCLPKNVINKRVQEDYHTEKKVRSSS